MEGSDMKKEREAFFNALIEAKKKFRKPVFNKSVGYGKTSFKYADLSEIMDCIEKPLLDNNILISQPVMTVASNLHVRLSIQHLGGYLQEFYSSMSIEGLSMQQIGAQITYLKRYMLASYFGLVADEDNDAKEIENIPLNESRTISEENALELATAIEGMNGVRAQLFRMYKIDDIRNFPKDKFESTMLWIKKIKEKNGGAQ